MFYLIAAVLYSCVSTGLASTQTPIITPCSATHIVIIDDVKITNAKVGETMVLSYSGQLTQTLDGSPKVKLTIMIKKGNIKLPCIADLGSCVYKMCGGNTTIEQEIGEPWNNVCPFASLNYSSSVGIKIPSIARLVIGDGNLHLKIVALDGGSVVGCKEFDFNIALS
ncbi:immunoglobulin-binding protein, putative [Ixodes scapularis]|uniref:Immunoglobulin-binding protein, putative n=1 Tax=Ixodes scapularis TaxID=6945 RepID=B7Q5V2_IXOSC|nr:immunoglobulin-binding protein, putative [Ixodes scapularis]|eukprot:XP_002411823.1 immunoglobulin-binding protein, putative [Ixodes scapularis]